MHPTRNTLPETIRAQSVELLNLHLAAAIDLHGQLKQAHWNVRGPGFFAVHTLFDTVASAVEVFSDEIAERARSLGGTAYGTIQIAVTRSFLLPYPLDVADATKHIFAVSAALAAFGQSTRDASTKATTIGDASTADVFAEVSRGIEKHLWFVESHAAPQ